NVPSLLGLHALPPFMHNGAAESLAAVVSDVKHRTDNGRRPDVLTSPSEQALVVTFLESIDLNTIPFVALAIRIQGNQVYVAFDSIQGVHYALEAKPTLTSTWASTGSTTIGNGQRMELAVSVDLASKFLRLVPGP